MKVFFDAEALVAFAFDESGAGEVEQRLNDIYDGEIDGYVTTINLAEFRYIATRKTSTERADTHIENLKKIGVNEYSIDPLWQSTAELKARYSPALGDAYAVAAATEEEENGSEVILLVGTDDDYGIFEKEDKYEHLIKRFRPDSV